MTTILKDGEIGFCHRHGVPILVDRSEDDCIKVLAKGSGELDCGGCLLLRERVSSLSFFTED